MGQPSDVRGTPGELVMVRGTSRVLCATAPTTKDPKAHTTLIPPKSLGLILSTGEPGWTYVLWSNPLVLGWSQDGALRRLNQKG